MSSTGLEHPNFKSLLHIIIYNYVRLCKGLKTSASPRALASIGLPPRLLHFQERSFALLLRLVGARLNGFELQVQGYRLSFVLSVAGFGVYWTGVEA